MKRSLRSILAAFASLALLFSNLPSAAAPPVKVDAATPSSGEQGTLDMDVVITGSSFEPGAAVDFLVTGSNADKGNVVVKSVTYNSSTKLTAKVSLQNAKISDFDVKVTLMSGRNGKGISLFKVVAKANGDVTPPAPIGSIEVKSSGLALTLRFVAPGDDGSSGDAVRYDVFYRLGSTCSDADNPGASPDANAMWTRAQRSAQTYALPAGSLEFFNVRPLSAGNDYCLAVRTSDEVPNWSSWRVVGGTTEPEWTLAATWAVAPTDAAARRLALVTADATPIAAWRTDNRTASFAGAAWQQTAAITVASTSFSNPQFRVAANPAWTAGGSVPALSAVWTNTYTAGAGKNQTLYNRYILIEAGPDFATRISDLASGPRLVGGLDEPYFGGSTVAYALKNGAWNPVVTLERIERKDSTKRTSLTVSERVGMTWQESNVLTHEGPDQRYGFFEEAEVATKTDGELAFVAPHCGATIYGERAGASWTYWVAGPALVRYRVGYDSSGNVTISGQTSYGAPDPVVLRSGSFAALPGKPAATCGAFSPPAIPPGEVVSVGLDADLPWLWNTGVAVAGGATFLSMALSDGNLVTSEQRVVYSCGSSDPWHVLRADRTHSTTNAATVLAPDGSVLSAYAWGRFARLTSLPSYTGLPPDFVYVSNRAANPCGVVP